MVNIGILNVITTVKQHLTNFLFENIINKFYQIKVCKLNT